jgi:hypothetical protein
VRRWRRSCSSSWASRRASPNGTQHPGVQKSELNAHGEKENPPQPTVKGANLDSDPKNGGIEGQEPANAPWALNRLLVKQMAFRWANLSMLDVMAAKLKIRHQIIRLERNRLLVKQKESKCTKSENTELELAKAETAAANAKVETLQKSLDAVQQF